MAQDVSSAPASLRKRIETAAALVIAGLIVWFVWNHTNSQEVLNAFKGINWLYYAAAVAALFAYQFVRTLRTRRLIDAEIGLSELFVTMCMLTLVNSYVLAGIGDIGLVYFLHRRHGIGLHVGAAVLIMAAVVDVLIFAILFLVLVGAIAHLIPEQVYLVITGAGGAVLVAAAAAIGLARFVKSEQMVAWSRRSDTIGRVAQLTLSFAEALQLIRQRRVLLPVLGQSALMWIFHFLQWLFVLRALGLSLSPISVLWIYLLFFIASFLPFRGIAGMGPRVAIWFFSFQLVGVEETQAAAAALSADVLLQSLSLWVGAAPLAAALRRVMTGRRR